MKKKATVLLVSTAAVAILLLGYFMGRFDGRTAALEGKVWIDVYAEDVPHGALRVHYLSYTGEPAEGGLIFDTYPLARLALEDGSGVSEAVDAYKLAHTPKR